MEVQSSNFCNTRKKKEKKKLINHNKPKEKVSRRLIVVAQMLAKRTSQLLTLHINRNNLYLNGKLNFITLLQYMKKGQIDAKNPLNSVYS